MNEHFFAERAMSYRANDLDPDRETLVFIHGLAGSSSAWLPFERHFENDFNVVTMDLRGHGRSKHWPAYDDYDFSFFASDVRALLQRLGVRHYILIAHSFGTLIALELLLRGNGARRAFLLSPNYAIHRLLRARLTRAPLAIITAIFSHLPSVHWRGDRVDYSTFGCSPDWDLRRLYADIRNTGVRTYLHCLHHVYAFSSDDDWKRISVPVSIVHGARDSFIPVAHAVELASIIPQAEIVVLDSANHMLVLNNIEEISRAIKRLTAHNVIS